MPVNTAIRLTQLEERLRELFLDVAAFVDKNPTDTKTESSEEPVTLRFTGGWVRDKLLGSDSHDIDIGVNRLTGMQFGLALQQFLQLPGKLEHYGLNPDSATVESGDEGKPSSKPAKKIGSFHKIEANPEKSKHLETATIKILGTDVDVVNLRKETYTQDSRNPQMMFGTPEEDALRRDATVNAMFYNLHTETVEDFTGKGLEDLENRIIRTPLEPYQTFKDDPLRVLRLIRFASRLDFVLEESVREAMKDESIKEALRLKISRERVGTEVEKMLRGPHPRQSLQLIEDAGLYRTIFEDPAQEPTLEPDLQSWPGVIDFYELLLKSPAFEELRTALITNKDEEYLGWLLASGAPWKDAPADIPRKGQPIRAPPAKMLQGGLKLGNKYADVISSAYGHLAEIRSLVEREGLKEPEELDALAKQESVDRGRFAMTVRNWGRTWRSSILAALIVDVGATSQSFEQNQDVDKFIALVRRIEAFGLSDVYDRKHIVNGNDLCKALGVKNGKWMRNAMDMIMEWQLGFPQTATKNGAVELVRSKAEELGMEFKS